jgi:hypothetical protein
MITDEKKSAPPTTPTTHHAHNFSRILEGSMEAAINGGIYLLLPKAQATPILPT